MSETKKKDWIFIGVILILGFVLGYFIFDDVQVTYSNELLQKENTQLLDSIEGRNAKMKLLDDSLTRVQASRVRLAKSIQIIIDKDGKIDEKYKDLYLDVDTANWSKLDSLSTIILQGDSI